MNDCQCIQELSREELLKLTEIYAKNWLAIDGLWFQSIEKKRGMQEALENDEQVWRRFTEIEARRIKQFLELEERPGLEGLRRALQFRLYAPLNETQTYFEKDALIYRVRTCRVQAARQRKGMQYHPCKPVGLVEYTYFAKTIDERIQTEALSCHPDITIPECNCVWKFTLTQK